MKILSWMAIGRGKKQMLIKKPHVPQVMIKPVPETITNPASKLEHLHVQTMLSAETIPSPNLLSLPLLTNPASKLELLHVQTIPLLEQFETVCS